MRRILSLAVAAFALSVTPVSAQPDDPLPPRAFQKIGTSKFRHGSRILSLAYSPDGQTLIAGGGNDPVRFWNAKTGQVIREINEPWVNSFAFSPSGETLVMGGYQKIVRMWSLKLNKEIGRLDGHKAPIKAVAVAPDTSTIASASQDGLIYLWDWNTKSKVTELRGHTDEVTAIAFSHDRDSTYFASGGSDRTIVLWDLTDNKIMRKLDTGCAVLAIDFAADGKTLFSAGDDHLIRRWDVAAGKLIDTLRGHENTIVSLVVAGDSVITGSLDQSIRIWDAKTGNVVRTIRRGAGAVDALAVSKSGSIATAGLSATIRQFDAKTGAEILPHAGPASSLHSLFLTRDNKRLVGVAFDGQAFVWEATGGKLVRQWDTKLSGDTICALANDGKSLAVAGDSVRVFDASTGIALASLTTEPVVALAWSPDGAALAIGVRSGQIDLWNLAAKKVDRSLKYPGLLQAVAWSPDGEKLVAAGGQKMHVWNAISGDLTRSFDIKDGPAPKHPIVASLVFSPDSKTIAAGLFDASIRVFNVGARIPSDPLFHRSCEGHASVAYALAFSPDGRTLISGSFDRTVRLFEAFSGKTIATFKGHGGTVVGVAFTPDGRAAFSGSADTVVYQWDVPGLTGKGTLPDLTLTPQEVADTWTQLTIEDTAKGHETLWRAIASPKQAVPSLTNKIYLVEPENVRKLFKELDSGNFATRNAAMVKLIDYGRWMEGRYDEALIDPPSLEYKRRVEILKDKLNQTNSPSLVQERLRLRRFMLICEQVGSVEAIEALQLIAARGPEEDLRDEAKGSVERLKKRK
ncbi:MAG: WD40 repeat domain-containing protein [Gemmataceae bacterium]|nr:WD40 repeat domain-containing protein [Gemmataceae bacterium]